jgi:hypothetical protein
MKKYGLVNKKNGNVVVLDSKYNGDDRYACGEYTYRLREEKSDLKDMSCLNDLWLLSSPQAVMAVLNESTEWFNADTPEKPNHSLKPDDFEILEVEITFSCYKDRSHIANVHGER